MVFCCPNYGEIRNTENLEKCFACEKLCGEPLVRLQMEFHKKYHIPGFSVEEE
jgi:hypothetical protein